MLCGHTFIRGTRVQQVAVRSISDDSLILYNYGGKSGVLDKQVEPETNLPNGLASTGDHDGAGGSIANTNRENLIHPPHAQLTPA